MSYDLFCKMRDVFPAIDEIVAAATRIYSAAPESKYVAAYRETKSEQNPEKSFSPAKFKKSGELIFNYGLADEKGVHIGEHGSIPKVMSSEKSKNYQLYIELPTDFSPELLALTMNKRLNSYFKKENYNESKARIENYGRGEVEVRDVLLPLDKFIESWVNRDRSKDPIYSAARQ